MSVHLDFTIGADEFALGRILSVPTTMHLELERIVPAGETIAPFVWATGADHAAFERQVRESPLTGDVLLLDRVGDAGLYRIEWREATTDLLAGIAESEAAILEAQGDGEWRFRLRFAGHDRLSQFYNYCTDHDLPVHIERTYTHDEESQFHGQFDISHAQREALVLALRRGYFDTPSKSSLDELAADLDISRQALSNRIRRGNREILRAVLLASGTEAD